MDVPQTDISTAVLQSHTPPTTRTPLRRKLLGIWSALASDFCLEVSGERMALSTTRTVPRKGALDAEELKSSLGSLHYAFQPITVVLHPPTVCIKTFNLDGADASQWLTEHLHKVFPPGDRRQMRMVSAICRDGQLMVAVVNKGVLNHISQTIWQAGGSVKAIVPAVAFNLATTKDTKQSDVTIEWVLAQYDYATREGTLSIWSSEADTECRSKRFDDQPFHQSHLLRQLDFLPQLKATKPPATRHLVRTVRASLVAITALLLLTLFLYLAGSVYRSLTTTDSTETRELSNRVTALQEQNRDLRQQLGGMQSKQSGEAIVGRVLYAVAHATPDDTWLRRLEVQKMSDANAYEFRLSGRSRSDKSPAEFASALADNPDVEEAHLSRVGKNSDSMRDRTITRKATEFDIQGRTRANDHD